MPNKSITLHIIAKDELKKVCNIIQKYLGYFDAIDIAYDDDCFADLGKHPKVNLYKYEKTGELLDFAHKRNFLVDKCKTDYYFRLDTDDEIANPEAIKSVIASMVDKDIQVITCYYDYAKDEWGNTCAAHYRETIIENNNLIRWVSTSGIHECIIPKDRTHFTIARNDALKIIHHTDKNHSILSSERNFKYLIREYNRDKEKTDPRTIAYLARTLHGIGETDKAIYFYEKHIERSGWDDDRYLSWCQLGDIYLRFKNDYKTATACAFEALQEKPDFPDAYFLLHDIYFNQDQWKKSAEWGLMGFSKPAPDTNMFVDPSSYTWRPLLSLAECFFQMGDIPRAKKTFDEAKKFVPTLDYVKDVEKVYTQAVKHDEYVKHLIPMVRFLQETEPERAIELVNSIPKELYQHETIAQIRKHFLPPKLWGKYEVAIFCGFTLEEWSPKSAVKGIGGSEEAVINLSKELNKLGYKVTVYNNCGEDEGEYDGVLYQNFVRFNHKDRFNILISWRMNIFAYPVEAKNKILWIHDLPLNLELDSETVRRFDKIVMLSKYHASLLPEVVPKEKIYISTNGIDKTLFKGEVGKRKNSIIWASSYNRGLETILTNWKKIRSEVPDATIRIFYGWDTYDRFVKDGAIKDAGFKERMLLLFKQDGVFEGGRIGHKELAEEYQKSEIFAYPCSYSGEINCIALSKAIQAGLSCVTNDKFVLAERNPHYVVSDEQFVGKLTEVLKSSNRKVGGQVEDWHDVAVDWSINLFPISFPTEVIRREEWSKGFFDKQDKIIDIGANRGDAFLGWDRSRITSVDIDKYDYEGFVQAQAEDLPFPDKSFDKALLGEIVEHSKTPVKVLQEANRVANMSVITVPYEVEWEEQYYPFNTKEKELARRRKDLKEIAKEGNQEAKEFAGDNFDHLWHQTFYTPELLYAHLKEAGFKDIKITKLRHNGVSWLGAVAK